jgi:hypothetical protein
MRFLGRAKVRFDAKVQLQSATLKPSTATSSEIRRLGDFHEAQSLAVKPARHRFAADRHGQLNVIDAANSQCASFPNVS